MLSIDIAGTRSQSSGSSVTSTSGFLSDIEEKISWRLLWYEWG